MTFGISISGALESCSGSAWCDYGSQSFSGPVDDVVAQAVAFVKSGQVKSEEAAQAETPADDAAPGEADGEASPTE